MRLRPALLVMMSFLALLVLFAPQAAHAQATSTTTMCNDGSFDNNFNNNRSAVQQGISTMLQNINTLFPVAPAMSQCVQNVMNVFKMLPGLADPLSIAQSVINPLLQSILSSVCSSVMSTITSAQQAVGNLAKICLPTLSFSGLDLPSFSVTSCTGGTSVNLLTSFQSAAPNTYSYSQFQSH